MADQNIDYKKAVDYWSSVSADYDGVLGGFGNGIVPKADIVGSQAFIRRLRTLSPGTFPNARESTEKTAVDVGAGVGRVTKDLISKYVEAVDLVEPAKPLIEEAKNQLKDTPQARDYYPVGLQDFEFPTKYWVIWCQWCLGQVPDDELVNFLETAKANLQEGGVIIVKENQAPMEDIYDETDSSVTRTDLKFREIFEKAGLRLLLTALNKGMPRELFPIRMYALAPRED